VGCPHDPPARPALVVPLAIGQALAAAMPTSELAVIDGAGHNAMWDRPAAFNRLALRFLAGGVD
jgi:pimeloyl-ACP methyl ester carboxylesterase